MWTLISNVYYVLGTDLTHTPSGSTSQARVLIPWRATYKNLGRIFTPPHFRAPSITPQGPNFIKGQTWSKSNKDPGLRGCLGVRDAILNALFSIVLASLANLHHNG